jgi:uncharacterized membrane protein
MSQKVLSDKYIKIIEYFLEYSNHLSLFIAYVIILVGIVEGVIFLIKNAVNPPNVIKTLDHRTNNIIETRIKVLNSINLGLVFIIAGDIIKSIYMPDIINIIKVITIICIREVLSLFTNNEIEKLNKLKNMTKLDDSVES